MWWERGTEGEEGRVQRGRASIDHLPGVMDSAISGSGQRRRGESDFCFSKSWWMKASGGRPACRARHMMDCCVSRREIEGEQRGEGKGGRTRGWTQGWRGEIRDIKENVRRKVSEMGVRWGRDFRKETTEREREREMRAGGDSRVSSSLLMTKEQRGSY